MATKTSLADKVKAHEQMERAEKAERQSAVTRIASGNNNEGAKDRAFSGKVNDDIYNMFTAINKKMGLSNNSALNMLINKYVRENKSLLDEDI